MAEELQQLLEKIQRDGVEKANAEAAAIVAEAKAEAEALVKEAQEVAAATEAKGKVDAETHAKNARETLGNEARKLVGQVRNDITRLFTALLAQDVSAALATEAVPLAAAAVKELVSGDATAEVAVSKKLVDAIRAQLAAQAQGGVKVVSDETTGAGFTVKLENGRVEHDFTDAAIAEALAQHLRPDLAELLK